MIKRKVMEYMNGKDYINILEFFLINYFIYLSRSDGRKYKGFWKNGKRHGEGEFYYPRQKSWKKGEWVDDLRVKNNNESVTTASAQLSY